MRFELKFASYGVASTVAEDLQLHRLMLRRRYRNAYLTDCLAQGSMSGCSVSGRTQTFCQASGKKLLYLALKAAENSHQA